MFAEPMLADAPFPMAALIARVDTPVLTVVPAWEPLMFVDPILAEAPLPRAALVARVDKPVFTVVPVTREFSIPVEAILAVVRLPIA